MVGALKLGGDHRLYQVNGALHGLRFNASL